MYQKAIRDEHWQGVKDTIEQQMQNDQVWRDEQVPVPDSWQVMTNGSTTALRSLQLRMPNCRCGCPFYPMRTGGTNCMHNCIADTVALCMPDPVLKSDCFIKSDDVMQSESINMAVTPNVYHCVEDRVFELQPPIGPYRGWPEELGGQWYPTQRGPYSKDFLDLLRADAPQLPIWLDPDNSSNAAAADRVPRETFAFMPTWLGCGYFLRGRQGYWDAHITGNIAQQVHCC